MGKIDRLEQLFGSNGNLPRKQTTLLIGIDGLGGSGKSTLANKLKGNWPDVTVVHMDDFYLPSSQLLSIPAEQRPIGADYDWPRVLREVLKPLNLDEPGHYQRYDWPTDSLAEWNTVPAGGIVVVEGVYAIRQELAEMYDFTIWVNCPRKLRLSRGLERDGEEARDMWEKNWMVSENKYVEEYQPKTRVDLVLDGFER